jgi:RNA polymerase sigma-70 factor (sigma-E family)
MTTEPMHGPGEDYRRFVQSRAAPLHRAAYLLRGDWHLANDLVQEALARAFRHWRRVRRADNPDAYVHRILINEASRHWRRHRHVTPVADAAAHAAARVPPVPDAADRLVDRTELLHALLSLTPRQRATVVLRYLVGMSEREKAGVLGCSQGTVKSQSSRALTALRTYLTREESLR